MARKPAAKARQIANLGKRKAIETLPRDEIRRCPY